MVVKNGFACGIMLALVGCATKPVSNEQATPVPEKQIISTALLEKRDGTGEVIIKRDSGFFGSACFSRVYVDGKEVADLGTAQKSLYTQRLVIMSSARGQKEYVVVA